MTSIRLQALYSCDCPTKQEEEKTARHIYESSFPEDERRDFLMMKALSESEAFVFNLIKTQEEKVVGIISLWDFDGFCYIEHFALAEETRGKGTGSEVLRILKQKIQKPIVFEVELPESEQARRRIAFYRRHDFELLPYKYVQPPYDKTKRSMEMHIMASRNAAMDKTTFNSVVQNLYTAVYRLV